MNLLSSLLSLASAAASALEALSLEAHRDREKQHRCRALLFKNLLATGFGGLGVSPISVADSTELATVAA